MKRGLKSILTVLAVVGTFLIPSQRAEAKIVAEKRELINATNEKTPLVLQHAKDLQGKNILELAWHYSHSSHVSHSSHMSHYSHQSHVSHYSGW